MRPSETGLARSALKGGLQLELEQGLGLEHHTSFSVRIFATSICNSLLLAS